MHKFLLDNIRANELEAFLLAFNEIWITLALVYIVFFMAVFLMLRFFIESVTDEIDDINNYLEEINKKNYEAVLKIEHHLEFLRLSILLKNIVKRLKAKTK
jgi:predicted PurR-regulated permease PerM